MSFSLAKPTPSKAELVSIRRKEKAEFILKSKAFREGILRRKRELVLSQRKEYIRSQIKSDLRRRVRVDEAKNLKGLSRFQRRNVSFYSFDGQQQK